MPGPLPQREKSSEFINRFSGIWFRRFLPPSLFTMPAAEVTITLTKLLLTCSAIRAVLFPLAPENLTWDFVAPWMRTTKVL